MSGVALRRSVVSLFMRWFLARGTIIEGMIARGPPGDPIDLADEFDHRWLSCPAGIGEVGLSVAGVSGSALGTSLGLAAALARAYAASAKKVDGWN